MVLDRNTYVMLIRKLLGKATARKTESRGRVTLKWILRRLVMNIGGGLNCLGIVSNGELGLFIYGLFNETVRWSDYIASNGRMISEIDEERCGKKMPWPNLRYHHGVFVERTSVRIIGDPSEIRTGHIQNTSQKHRCLRQLTV
jgi:hypothetical protein